LNEQLFSDGIGSIAIVGGIVRIDLVVLSATEKDAGGHPKAVFQQQIVMGAEAFLRSTEKMHGAAQALAKLAAQQLDAPKQATERQAPEPDRPISASPETTAKRPFP
jgi:hypothetical protein